MKPISKSSQQGFNMIEVLIAIVIVAIGLLGIAGLQTALTRFNGSTYNRATAVNLALDMAERLRAYGTTKDSPYPTASPAVSAACFQATGCARDVMARHEYQIWLDDVARQLPGGRAILCLDSNLSDEETSTPTAPNCTGNAGTDVVWVIKIWWDDGRTGSSNFSDYKRFTLVY